jgi:hypothetical protein
MIIGWYRAAGYSGGTSSRGISMLTVRNLSDDTVMDFLPVNLPAGIDSKAWAVMAAHFLTTGEALSINAAQFTPRELVYRHIDRFVLGEKTIAFGDWCALL